jgi:DNA-binding response OmpR family regulator
VSQKRSILIVSPHPDVGAALAQTLSQNGYDVIHRERPADLPPADLALIDVSAGASWPDAEALPSRFMLIVDNAGAMGRGFGLGAEDCLLADAHMDEIAARCDAVLRRTDTRVGLVDEEEVAVYVDRRLWVNFGSHQVWVRGRGAHLTPREFRLLAYLIRHKDETLDHDRLLTAVWERPIVEERPTEVLKQYIWRLRQKIEEDPNAPDTIVTDPGAGYRFVSQLD